MPIVSMEMDISKMQKSLHDAKSAIQDISNSLDKAQENLSDTAKYTKSWNKEAEKAIKNQRALSDELKRATGIVAGLASAYLSLSKLMSFTKEGFAYNEELETSKLGIASVVAATLELHDAQGKVLEGQEKFNAAQAMSVEMAKALDIASMQSPASYTDLLSTYQRLLAPATNLGLKWQDTLDLTIKMSNVVKALGLDMQRLGAETESIMMGKNLSHSAVAQRLKITKEEIASWGQGEQLIAGLNKRLEQFKYAGASVEDTMSAVREYYDDVMKNISGDMNKNLWQKMKEAMLAVADEIYEQVEVNGRKQFQITESMQPIVDLWNMVGDIIGDKVVGSVQSLMESIKKFGDYLNERGITNFFDDITQGAKIAGAAIVALTVSKRAMNATFTTGIGANATEVVGLRAYLMALQERVQKEGFLSTVLIQGVAVENAKTAATSTGTGAIARETAATTQATAASRAHTAVLTQEAVATSNLSAKQKLVALSAAAMQKASAAGAAGMIGLRNIASGLLGIFGGPWGLALTAAGAGLAYLATQESDAERATRLHTQAQEAYEQAIAGATDETGNLTKKLTDVQKARLNIAKTNAEEALTSKIDQAKEKLEEFLSVQHLISSNFNTDTDIVDAFFASIAEAFDPLSDATEETKNAMNQLFEDLQRGDVKSFHEHLVLLINGLNNSESASDGLMNALNELLKLCEADDGLLKMANDFDKIKSAADQATSSVNQVGVAIQEVNKLRLEGLDNSILSLKEENEILNIQNKKDRELASYLVKRHKGISVETAKHLMQGHYQWQDKSGKTQSVDAETFKGASEEIKLFRANQVRKDKIREEEAAARKKGGSGSKNAFEKAGEGVQRLRLEILQLSGEMSKSSVDFDKKMKEIDKLGAEAKLSAEDIQQLKKDYADAFKINTLKEFNKEVLNLEGNVNAVRKIELEDKVKEWEDKLRSCGIEGQELNDCMGRLKSGLERDIQFKDTQTAIAFLKELNALGQEYGITTEYQNRLLELQAQMYQQKLPASLQPFIDKWKELQKLQNRRDPWAGIQRGTLKFVEENTDYAKQMETIWTNTLDGIGDALADMCIKGEASFGELATSIIEDIERLMIKSAEAQVVNGIMNFIMTGLSSYFGGGGMMSAGAAITAANGIGGSSYLTHSGATMGSGVGLAMAQGGIFSGGNLHAFSNRIVSSPTVFNYGTFHAFAKGAGLMGEAGPEAIMPLTRNVDGTLGVRAYSDSANNKDNKEKITVNIYNYGEKNVKASENDNMDGNRSIDVIIGDIAASQAQKPGTNLNKALRSLTGSNQQVTRR